jgi:hypothetical protein
MEPEKISDTNEREPLSGEDNRPFAESSQRKCKSAGVNSGFPFKMCPEPVGFAQLSRQQIRILILVDGGITFGNEDYGLSLFLNALNSDDLFICFNITKANRRPFDDTADYPGFSFEKDFIPDHYDEVWLFGAESLFTNKLREKELEILARFMVHGLRGGRLCDGGSPRFGRSTVRRSAQSPFYAQMVL